MTLSGNFFKLKRCRWLPAVLVLAVLTACSGSKTPVIGLMTDLGLQDQGVVQIKGMIVSVNPRARILDLNHSLPGNNLAESAYLLDKTARYFPSGSIFIVETGPMDSAVVLETALGHFFLGPDNGIFTQVLEREGVEHVVTLGGTETIPSTLSLPEMLATAAARLSMGGKVKKLGTPLRQLVHLKLIPAGRLGRKVTGQVMAVSREGRITSNITPKTFEQDPAGKLVKLAIEGKTISVPVVHDFAGGPEDRLFAYFNNDDELEFAYKGKPVAELQRARFGTPLAVTY